ncbi:MAG: FAD-binding oxidoreductase [Pseudomonadota bacterium]
MKSDVLVIGGGLAGCTTALMLAMEGVGVVVVDEGVLIGRASSANAGSIHLQIPFPEYMSLGHEWATRYAKVLPMMQASVALWRELESVIGAAAALRLEGGLLVATTQDQMAAIARKVALENSIGLEITVIDRATLRAIAPYLAPNIIGGAWCPDEGKANPLTAGPALVAAARARGVRFFEDTPVTRLERERSHWRATTPTGEFVAGRIINAAGAAAARVAAMAGVPIAVEGFPIQASVTEAATPFVPHLVYSAADKLTLKQTAGGHFIIGGGWPSQQSTSGALSVDPASVAANMMIAAQTVPAIGRLRVARTWPAIVNGTADWMPLIGEAPGSPGFYLALFPWMGFTGAPITARIVADLIVGREAPVDPALLLAA